MSEVKSDIQIAREAKMQPINDILAKMSVPDESSATLTDVPSPSTATHRLNLDIKNRYGEQVGSGARVEVEIQGGEAVTELSKQSVALQALQASFVKVAELSLFNYLR